MTNLDSGDVVLVRYPFTDFSGSKKRPAIVLSPGSYQSRFGDVVIMPLTSQRDDDESLKLEHWRLAGLLKPTWVKPIIGTLSASLIERRLGALMGNDEERIRSALAIAVADRWRSARGQKR